MSIKRYPCCSSSHTAIDGVVGIMRTTGWNVREVAGIDVWIGEDITRILLYDYPKSALEGKFSLRYCVATAALHGPPTLAAFEGEAFSSRSIIEMMRKVNIHVDPELPRSPNGVTEESRVRITTLSGERVERRVPVPLGSPSLPMPQEELNEKFLNCLHGVVGVTQGRRLLSCLREFPNASSIANIVSEIVAAIGERD